MQTSYRDNSSSPHTDAACHNMPMHAQRYERTRCEAQSKPDKKKNRPFQRRKDLGRSAVAFLCCCPGVKMRYVAMKNAARLPSAACHLSSYQRSEKQPLGLINVFEANHESEPLGPRIPQSVKAIPETLCIPRCMHTSHAGGPSSALNRALVFDSKITFFQQAQ